MTNMEYTGRLVTSFISRKVFDDKELIKKTRLKGILIGAAIFATAGILIYLTNRQDNSIRT